MRAPRAGFPCHRVLHGSRSVRRAWACASARASCATASASSCTLVPSRASATGQFTILDTSRSAAPAWRRPRCTCIPGPLVRQQLPAWSSSQTAQGSLCPLSVPLSIPPRLRSLNPLPQPPTPPQPHTRTPHSPNNHQARSTLRVALAKRCLSVLSRYLTRTTRELECLSPIMKIQMTMQNW